MHINDNSLSISSYVLPKILDTIGSAAPERGGVLGAGKNGIVTEYYYDATSPISADRYVPDVKVINKVLSSDWIPHGIFMVGIVHSHSNGNSVPSCGDISYGIRILNALTNIDAFYLPIVSFDSGIPQINAYVLMTDCNGQYICRKIGLKIIDDRKDASI